VAEILIILTSINASYTIPIDKLPLLGWTSATARYKATFDWTASPQLDSIQLGNTLSNSNTINLSSSLNFSKIYSKVPFLKNISDKMRRGANANKKYKDVKYVKENVRLKEGVGESIVHNLQTEEVTIKVTDENGKDVEGELVVVNNKKVKFRAKGNVDNANVEVTGKKEIKQNFLKTIGEGLVNIAIGLKNVSLSYSETKWYLTSRLFANNKVQWT
jgi:cell surface protein SprA